MNSLVHLRVETVVSNLEKKQCTRADSLLPLLTQGIVSISNNL